MERADKQPKYRVIASYLRDRILDGTYVAGQALPSEEVLAKEFGVTRPTVRQGISELRAAGLVEAAMGRGTFVRSPHARPNITRPRGVRRAPDGRYIEADAIRWNSQEEPTRTRTDAPLALADLLRIPPGEPMFTYDEVHTAEHGRLRQTHRTYVPFSVLVGTPYEETAPPPAPELFTELEKLGHELHWTEHVRTRMPMPDEASTLRLAEGVPLFQILRVTYNQAERPLALEEFKLPGDDLEVTYNVPS
ncbi:GntR family transcriptional regulator [Yinghuangia sp. ASG 101]|uniref:GntR family transcriptional regulator n=1 Tax=Yinghuangia sp. ASG 101 TaxID=2896848 RepID=UPI001E33F13E|nr:GntR family transcriptional regulator [Yinghuangia sp. ASG 101]UGQ14281.1 GntR family transcriptional regulator [Yinghuangia sp. ASG 101]